MVQQKQFNLLNTSKNLKMEFIRTPKEIWQSLSKEFKFTVDACASNKKTVKHFDSQAFLINLGILPSYIG